jgi:hypothetical protein
MPDRASRRGGAAHAARPFHDERHFDCFIVQRRAVPPAPVVLELLAVIGNEYNRGPVVDAIASGVKAASRQSELRA